MIVVKRLILPAGLVIAGVTALFAQPSHSPSVPPGGVPPTTDKKSARVWLAGKLWTRDDVTKIHNGKGGVILRFTRNEMPPDFLKPGKDLVPKDLVPLENDDSRLTTEAALYNETTQIATAPGKMKLEDTYNTLTGNTGTAYYKTRDAKIRGDVVIVAQPREEDKNAPEGSSRRQFDSPITLTCQKVDYNWRTRIALASEQLTVKQKDRTVTADRAVYDGKREIVVLEGNVHYTRPNGETYKAIKFTIVYTKGKENFTAESPYGAFPVEEDPEGGDSATPADAKNKNPVPPAAPVAPPPATPPPTKPETNPR